jgi:hypothetical protein
MQTAHIRFKHSCSILDGVSLVFRNILRVHQLKRKGIDVRERSYEIFVCPFL